MTFDYRIENDFLGEKKIPANALYGIHSQRASENFPDKTPFHIEWYKAVGVVKKACYITYSKFKNAAQNKLSNSNVTISFIDNCIIDVLIESADEIANGHGFEHFIVPAVQGGAGTSINMNINEIIANLSLQKLGEPLGEYQKIDPIEHANIYQSTNDVIPTALKVAAMKLLNELEISINTVRKVLENLENKYRNVLRIGYTQMQEAVPSTFGKLFAAYNEALSRDWWRVSKCFERIKMVNLGGSAIGTSIAVPRYFVMNVVAELQQLTSLPIGRSENMPDATSNLDSWVEIHSILKANAVNLEKIVSDIRLLASDIVGNRFVQIPQKQAGSSIMPNKVNPVIAEFVISAAHKIYANDMLVSSLCGQGCLELNAYLPLIGHSVIDTLKLLIASCNTLANNMLNGLEIDVFETENQLSRSTAIVTALTPYIGYNKAAELSKLMKAEKISVFEANQKLKILPEDRLANLLNSNSLMRTGFTLGD